ncbi:MAG TPA: sigma-70 family RNA polymerase sigma factor [Planctomycetota bacterium]|nr:sigma-70 family RNA polymerase sigma factor [Planctomycetota bacterium]
MEDDPTRSAELILRVKAGDREALERLVERYYERVRRIVRLQLGPALRVSVDSCDILQETFAAAGALEGFEPRDEGSLIRWLARIAERQILAAADRQSAARRDKRREVPLSGAMAQLAADATAPPDRVERDEAIEAIEQCIRELPEPLRELILARDYAGASWESVAQLTGRPSADAARVMHARALSELARLARARGLA